MFEVRFFLASLFWILCECVFCNLMFHMRLIAQLYAFIAGNLTVKGREKHTKVATDVFFCTA